MSTTDALDLDTCEVCGLEEEDCASCAPLPLPGELFPPPLEGALLTASPRVLLLWHLLEARASKRHHDDWYARSVAEVGFLVHHHSCIRCGREHISAYSYGEGRHFCASPYFRPRGRLHPAGPTKPQQHEHANPTLF